MSNLVLPDKIYNILKWFVVLVLPAIATLCLTLTGIWNLPYGEAISATITAIDAFFGVILQISSNNYKKNK